ncbi:MAG: ribosome hibernation-promoting factor, HPF/YfiA family [Myxococcota bacterium]
MELEFTFRNVEPTDAIKAWANKRFQKVTKHLKDPSSAHLVVVVDKFRHRAELTVHSHGEILRATDETDDMYTALDGVMQKLEQVAQRQKERTGSVR